MLSLTVLYDIECGLCRRAHEWLADQLKLVELNFVPCASDEARKRYPQLNHDLTKQDLTVITEDGWVYFIHGWTQVIAEVFAIDIPTSGPGFEAISQLAAEAGRVA